MDIREDVWLSGVLGYPVFAVDADGAAALGEHAAGQARALYFAKVPVERTAEAAALSAAGMAVVDVNVTLERHAKADVEPPTLDVEPLRTEDVELVLDIAGSCFRVSRFHLDALIPRESADRVKREWIASYIAGRRGIELLVARDGDTPVGFLAVLEDGDVRVIDLVGVAQDAQGRGVGTALVAAFIARHAPHARRLRVGTQIANTPSLHVYARFGFVVERSAYVLHRHVGAGA